MSTVHQLFVAALTLAGVSAPAAAQCTGVGLHGYDGGTIYLLPTQSITLYPYEVTFPNCNYSQPQPCANCTITFTPQGIDNTGGHMHPHSGMYLQPSGSANPTSCTTDSNGNCPAVTYTATYVSQEEIFGPFGNTSAYVQYQDIYQYNPANPSTVSLTGYRSEHPSNHFGTVTLGNGVNGVAASWYSTYGSALLVNDMAL